MGIQTYKQEEIRETVDEWLTALDRLLQQVTDWIQQQPDWAVLPTTRKTISEEAIGTYEVSVLAIETPDGRLVLEPMARIVLGGRGSVEFYAWPTLYRVRLLRTANSEEWVILTDSGIKLREPWNRETFITLAQDLLGAA